MGGGRGGEEGLESIHRGSMGELKMVLKNTCEGVHLLLKFPAISLHVCIFTKNKLQTNFSMILSRF